jgi:hypothetical protein
MQDVQNYYNTYAIKTAYMVLWIIHKIKKIHQLIKYCLNATLHYTQESL